MAKHRTATEQFDFLERIGLLWQLYPEKSFGLFIAEAARNGTDLFVIKDKELLKRLEKDNTL